MLPLNPEAFEKMTNEELFKYCRAELEEVNKKEGLSRQARRKYQRDFADMEKAIKSLSPHQMQLVKALSQMQAYQMTQDFSEKATGVMEDTFKATLVMLDFSNEQIEIVIEKAYEILTDEVDKSFQFKKICGGNEEMAIKNLEEIMIQAETMAKELIEKSIKQNEMVEILTSKIHLLSKAKAAKAISNIKAQMKDENKDVDILEENQAVEDIANVILEKEESKDVAAPVIKEVKEEKEMAKKSNLKVIKSTIVLEGENGTYTKEGDKVVLDGENGTLVFNSKEEVMDFAAEICEVYGM